MFFRDDSAQNAAADATVRIFDQPATFCRKYSSSILLLSFSFLIFIPFFLSFFLSIVGSKRFRSLPRIGDLSKLISLFLFHSSSVLFFHLLILFFTLLPWVINWFLKSIISLSSPHFFRFPLFSFNDSSNLVLFLFCLLFPFFFSTFVPSFLEVTHASERRGRGKMSKRMRRGIRTGRV